jgi:uncharacterized protein YgbK (DUF1537 family)
MRHHPLNPMTNPNLVTHLQSQTRRRVGLVAHPSVAGGTKEIRSCFERLQSEGVEIAIVDCISVEDMRCICRAAGGLKLISGSSAPGRYLPYEWQRRTATLPAVPEHRRRGFLVIAGSYSEATARQNAWLREHGAAAIKLEALRVANEGVTRQDAAAVRDALHAGAVCLVELSRDKEQVVRYFQAQGISGVEAGERISRGLAQFARTILEEQLPEGLILAGGETSSTISRVLGFGAFQVGPNIEPGVPVCVPLTGPAVPVVLKSGNFGSTDFYERAMGVIRSLPARQALRERFAL